MKAAWTVAGAIIGATIALVTGYAMRQATRRDIGLGMENYALDESVTIARMSMDIEDDDSPKT